MAVRYTEEQLNTVDKSLLIQMVLNQQEQLESGWNLFPGRKSGKRTVRRNRPVLRSESWRR